jgi:hypothetical protein
LLLTWLYSTVGLFFWLILSRLVLRPERLAAFSLTIGLDGSAESQRFSTSQRFPSDPTRSDLIRSLTHLEAIQARLQEL